MRNILQNAFATCLFEIRKFIHRPTNFGVASPRVVSSCHVRAVNPRC